MSSRKQHRECFNKVKRAEGRKTLAGTMCSAIGVNLQRGMNFRLREAESIILMSLRPGAPYADQVEDEGRVLIYEGHDVARTLNGPHPKQVDQPERNPGGSLTQNGLFAEAVRRYKDGTTPPERVKV